MTLRPLLLPALVLLSLQAQAQPQTGVVYWSLQLSGGSERELVKAHAAVAELPYARVERHGNHMVLRAGFWADRADAEKALSTVSMRFKGAFVRDARFRPDAVKLGWEGSGPPIATAAASTHLKAPTKVTATPARRGPPSAPTNSTTQGNILSFRESSDLNVLAQKPVSERTDRVDRGPDPRAPRMAKRDPAPLAAPVQVAKVETRRAPVAASQAATPAASSTESVPADKQTARLREQLRQGDFAGVLAEIRRGSTAGWQPPADLLMAALDGDVKQRIDRALKDRDGLALMELGQANADKFGCDRPEAAWTLAEVQHNAEREAGLMRTVGTLLSCPEADVRIATLERGQAWLERPQWRRLLDKERANIRDAAVEERYQTLVYADDVSRMVAAQESKDAKTMAALAQALEERVLLRRDTGVAMLLGWNRFNAGASATAERWFQRALEWTSGGADARRALARVALQDRRFGDARQWALALPAEDAERVSLLRDIALGQAQQASTEGRHADALVALSDAKVLAPLPRFARALEGWSLLNSGEATRSADIFTALYRETPDAESAQGALLSLTRASRHAELKALAASGPLVDMLGVQDAERAFSSKRFVAAAKGNPEKFGGLGAHDAPQITVTPGTRRKAGDPGTSKLDIAWNSRVEVSRSDGAEGVLQLRLDRTILKTGMPASTQQVGSVPREAAAFSHAASDKVQGWQGQVAWRGDATDGGWELELGRTVSGAPITATAVGTIARHWSWDSGHLALAAYRQSVRESLLAAAGITDPYSGRVWGRVTRNGVSAQFRGPIDDRWSWSAQMLSEVLRGQDVASNQRLGGGLNVGYAFQLAGFDYAVLGVGAALDQYRRNLSHYTYGHGGYFSPRRFWRVGPSLDFMTAENRPFMMKGRVAWGRTGKREEAAPFFPLAEDGRNFAASSGRGNAWDLELGAVWQLSPHVQAGAWVTRRRSDQYDDKAGLLTLRVLFEPRRNVLSTDLPHAGAADLL